MNLWFAVSLVVMHFGGDWLCQSRYMAMNKSKNIKVLFEHIVIVTAWLYIPTYIFEGKLLMLIPNAIIHACIDWNIWNFYKKKYGIAYDHLNNKGFYDTIALDQCLHIVCALVLLAP